MSRGPGCCALVIVVSALTAAGCGGGGKDSADTSKTTATTQSTTQAQTTAPAAAKLKLATLEKNLPEFLNSGRINVGTPGGGSTPSHAGISEASCPKEVDKKVG